MHDHFSELFEWDEDGKRPRRKRVAQDREQIHFPMTVMDDAAFGLRETFSDGSPDFTDPHRPGFRFLDTKDSAKLAADTSYWEMVARLDYRHRQQDGDSDDGSRQRTLDELEAAAAASYAARSKRMAEAWRQR
jgi:hypothetical protein